MEVDHAAVPSLEDASAVAAALEVDPEVVLLFPATAGTDARTLSDFSGDLHDAVDAPVVGASVGAWATAEADLAEQVAVAVGLADVGVETERFETAWDDTVDYRRAVAEGGDTVVTFDPSAPAGSGLAWRTLKTFAGRVLTRDSFGQRERLVDMMEDNLANRRIGYPPFLRDRIEARLDGAHVANFGSSDMGDFTEGFEIWNGEVTEKQSAMLVNLDTKLQTGAAQTALSVLSSDRHLETFEELGSYRRVIYRFGDETMDEIRERYGIGDWIGEGAFSYYWLLEMHDTYISVPITMDLDIVTCFTEVADDATAHLVRAMDGPEYRERFRAMLDDLPPGLPHLTVHPSAVKIYGREMLDRLVRDAQQRLDAFVFSVSDAVRLDRAIDYNPPGYVSYR